MSLIIGMGASIATAWWRFVLHGRTKPPSLSSHRRPQEDCFYMPTVVCLAYDTLHQGRGDATIHGTWKIEIFRTRRRARDTQIDGIERGAKAGRYFSIA